MAKRNNTRRTHASPGLYYKETVLDYSTQSLGITTLGLSGETVKGPAFQAIPIVDWREYQSYFGGTNTQKFRGSQYPKYELPYIAQEYLKQSKQLEVVRVLGLSGVNAGPAWVLTATKHDCKEGYQYESNGDTIDGVFVDRMKKGDNGLYTEGDMNVSLTVPQPVTNTESPVEQIYAADVHANTSLEVYYFDDNFNDEFNGLPEGLRKEFGTAEELKNYKDANDWKSFMVIDLGYTGDNISVVGGKLALIYEKNNKGQVLTIYDLDNCDTTSHTESGYVDNIMSVKSYEDASSTSVVTYKYIILPDTAFENIKPDEEYDKNYDFNKQRLSAYHYDYVNDDNTFIEETGKGVKYEVSELTTVCVEDTEASYDNVVIGILRSRGEHKRAVINGVDECGNPVYKYDGIDYYAKKVELVPSTTLNLDDDCNPGYNTLTGDFNADLSNYGRFTINVDSIKGCDICGVDSYVKHSYSVSLNPSDKNYITKVLGVDPEVGDADIYVEELYDVALEQLIMAGEVNAINSELVKFPCVNIIPEHAPVDDLMSLDASNLSKKYLRKRYLYTYSESAQNNIKVRVSNDNGITWNEQLGTVGHIYTVMSWDNPTTGKKEYFYGEYSDKVEYLLMYNYDRDVVKNDYILRNCVKCASDDMYYVYTDFDESDTANEGDVMPITFDMNNYKEAYRYSSTPWIVSEVKGSGENIKLHKLFRFHTISDGNNSVNEVKVSIENIDPDGGVFDVVIRSFYDTDLNPDIIERYTRCSLVPGTSNYLGLRIGTLDETYVSQSAYVTVEINEDDITMQSIPCGFLGYPVRNYNGLGLYEFANPNEKLTTPLKQPYVKFNTNIDDEIRIKKQYFGMSDLVGIDEDILSYKGVEAYNDDPDYLTPCFHLDARILNGKPEPVQENGVYYVTDGTNKQVVDVDGTTGYTWSTVSMAETTDAGIEPRIGTDDVMEGTIYEDKAYRKFTVCFYGGWDGWDYYRTSRSNGDDFRVNKYKGSINKVSGDGSMFSYMKDADLYGFDSDTKIINSDYYAYLAGVKQLDNPKTVVLNLFATPGIDYVNQTLLVNEIIDIIEEERGDSLYIVTTPDKPFGAGDSKVEMYTPEEAVSNLDASEIDTNYACTYYPWEKYFDGSNNQYIYLPVTLDVVRNMAYTDNIKYPWYASAGWNRGEVSGVEPKRKLKLAEQDTLYEGRINFINSFAKEGDKIWGDKNLQIADNMMNRISKRRLLIRLKNLLQNACIGLIFDPNDKTVADSFKSSVKSVLDDVKKNRGIFDYRIEVDDSDEARDRLELPAKIFIKPTPILEYIDIQLVVTPSGVVLD